MRDAVVEGFAVRPEDLKRVANPELLDDLASNAMSLRLGDEQFAREIYRDIRDQAIAAAERWHDVEVRIRLSSALERSTGGTPLFDVTVEAEYTTVPSGSVRRFACVSDRAEYTALREGRHDLGLAGGAAAGDGRSAPADLPAAGVQRRRRAADDPPLQSQDGPALHRAPHHRGPWPAGADPHHLPHGDAPVGPPAVL